MTSGSYEECFFLDLLGTSCIFCIRCVPFRFLQGKLSFVQVPWSRYTSWDFMGPILILHNGGMRG